MFRPRPPAVTTSPLSHQKRGSESHPGHCVVSSFGGTRRRVAGGALPDRAKTGYDSCIGANTHTLNVSKEATGGGEGLR